MAGPMDGEAVARAHLLGTHLVTSYALRHELRLLRHVGESPTYRQYPSSGLPCRATGTGGPPWCAMNLPGRGRALRSLQRERRPEDRLNRHRGPVNGGGDGTGSRHGVGCACLPVSSPQRRREGWRAAGQLNIGGRAQVEAVRLSDLPVDGADSPSGWNALLQALSPARTGVRSESRERSERPPAPHRSRIGLKRLARGGADRSRISSARRRRTARSRRARCPA